MMTKQKIGYKQNAKTANIHVGTYRQKRKQSELTVLRRNYIGDNFSHEFKIEN